MLEGEKCIAKNKEKSSGVDHIPGCRPFGPSTETPVECNEKKQSKSSIQCGEMCRESQEKDTGAGLRRPSS